MKRFICSGLLVAALAVGSQYLQRPELVFHVVLS
jgi:hypothetical protein